MKRRHTSSAVLGALAAASIIAVSSSGAVFAQAVPRAGVAEGENARPDHALPPGSPNAAGVPQKTDGDDVEFLTEALRTSMAEVEMGELAQQRGTAPVKELGKKLVADHSRAAAEIKQLLGTRNVTTAEEPTVNAEAHAAALAKLSGAEFDAAFLSLMVESHEQAIEEYGAQTHANPNKQLSEFASKTLPTLREHLASAKSLQSAAPAV